ncbi:hypothetical protein PMI07_006641 [Rhizobium sp. CF080]|nr:hypothetical protein PMI07_006641 [Rhizobium sp. CF080]
MSLGPCHLSYAKPDPGRQARDNTPRDAVSGEKSREIKQRAAAGAMSPRGIGSTNTVDSTSPSTLTIRSTT